MVRRARELLHEGDADGGCENRTVSLLLLQPARPRPAGPRLVLPFLQSLRDLAIEPVQTRPGRRWRSGARATGPGRQVPQAITPRPALPGEAQKVLYDGDEPVAIVDFVHAPRIVVFVDGSPTTRTMSGCRRPEAEAVEGGGCRIVVIRGEEMEQDWRTWQPCWYRIAFLHRVLALISEEETYVRQTFSKPR